MSKPISTVLVARIQSLQTLAAGPVTPPVDEVADVLDPPDGFRPAADRWAIVVSRGAEPLGAALLARAERRVLGRALARAALVGPLRAMSGHAWKSDAEDAYRLILDRLVFATPAPEIIGIRLLEDQTAHVDLLWRLALELDAGTTISAKQSGVRVDIIRPSRRSQLAMALALRPRLAVRDLWRDVRRRERTSVLLAFARDVHATALEVKPAVDVQFAPASDDELRQHPRRFGIGLATRLREDEMRQYFVGSVDGKVVYRMSCTKGPAALNSLLAAEVLTGVAEPAALVSDCSTVPEFRGRGIYPASLRWLAGWAKERGICTLVTLVAEDNASSLRGVSKAGFVLLGKAIPARAVH